MRNNTRAMAGGANSYGNLPQTVKPHGRKTFDLPELKPTRAGSRGHLFPSQGGSLTPMASIPNSIPFNQFVAERSNSNNAHYQTPNKKMKKKRPAQGPTIMGSHSYHNRKPDSGQGLYQDSEGYISIPNTGKKAPRNH